jgi:hypothetical protein
MSTACTKSTLCPFGQMLHNSNAVDSEAQTHPTGYRVSGPHMFRFFLFQPLGQQNLEQRLPHRACSPGLCAG